MSAAGTSAGVHPSRPGDVLLVVAAGTVALAAVASAIESMVLNRRLSLVARLVLAVAVAALPLSFPRPRADHAPAATPVKPPATEGDPDAIPVREEDASGQTARRFRIINGTIVPFEMTTDGKWLPAVPATNPRTW